jgi:glycosyltransferase involved in cell wall biosynthesis
MKRVAMKIGIDIRELSFSNNFKNGWYQYTYNLVSNLLAIDSNNDYTLLSIFSHGYGFKGDERIPQQFIHRFPGRLSRIFLEQFKIFIEFFLGKIDIFHGPCGFIPRSLSCKSIVTIHDLIPFRDTEFMHSKWAIPLKKRIYISAKRADAIIAVSNFTKREIIESFDIDEAKIQVIYQGVSPVFFPVKDDVKIQRIKNKYGLNGPYLLFVGNIEPRKNLETLIRAVVELRNSTTYKYPLLIVGNKDPHFQTIWEVVRQLHAESAILFTGVVAGDDLPFLYSGAEVFILPSLAEGFGIPLIEAMACGTPVVASNRTSIPEIAADAALLVEPLNVEAMAGAIYRVLSDPSLRHRLIKNGLKRVKDFSWERTAAETLHVYEELGSRLA